MAVGKTKRASKTSKGVHGGGGKMNHPNGLSTVQKVLMGKGMAVSTAPVEATPWLGATTFTPYDRAQAEENKRLYPHLFEESRRRAA